MTVLTVIIPALLVGQDLIINTGTRVTIENGWNIKIANGGDLILKDTSSSSASLIDRNSSSHVIFTGDGEANVQLFLQQDEWHYLSSSVNAAISGAFWNVYLKQFEETDSAWSYITTPNHILTPFQGYAAWASSSFTGDTTITLKGELNAGSFSKTVTNSGGSSHNSKGFNLIGNPYPSAINWQVGSTGWTRTNIDPTIYIWNPEAGQYGSYNRSSKAGTNNVDSIIPAKQGFFIHVSTTGTGTLGINYNAQVHGNKDYFKSEKASTGAELLDLIVTGNNYQDETIIVFNEDATPGLDNTFEAFKLPGLDTAPQLYTMADNTPLAINALKEVAEKLTIPLYFQAGLNGSFELLATNLTSFKAGQVILLEDKKENLIHNLTQNPIYAFAGSSADDPFRFVLHFQQVAAISDWELKPQIQIYGHQHTVYINMPANMTANAEFFNTLGQRLLQKAVEPGINKIHVDQSNTCLIVRIIAERQIESKKIFIQ